MAGTKKVNWRGGISLDRGGIVSYTPYALDQWDDSVRRVSNKVLRFQTVTSGDPEGVMLDIDAPPEAELHFFSDALELPKRAWARWATSRWSGRVEA